MNRSVAEDKRIQHVFPSGWLRELACRSVRFARDAEVIPNAIFLEPYKFRCRADARRELGLQREQKIVIVAAHYLAEPRKGVNFALSALRAVADLNPLVILVGIPISDLEVHMRGLRYWLAGFVRNKERMGLLFAAADVFLFSSLEENLPIMIHEAMAAGTPVVGFGAGGVPEMVKDQSTGWLCAPGDYIGLARKLREAICCKNVAAVGLAAQQAVREQFGVKSFVERHVRVYERMAEQA